ncbi:hypothetical protein ACFQ1S_31675, partial [Kibdelosporangium lantanae]
MTDTTLPGPTRRAMAEAALLVACSRAHLDARDAWLVRWVGNAVFQLRRDPVIVKVMTSRLLADRARA